MLPDIVLKCVNTHRPAPNNHKFIVDEDYTIKIYSSLKREFIDITIPKGFESDLASVDYRIPFAYSHIKMGAIASAVVHDYLYSTQILPRKIADYNLLKLSRKEGLPKFWAYVTYFAVRIGGGSPDHWKVKK